MLYEPCIASHELTVNGGRAASASYFRLQQIRYLEFRV
jgi:hypothetical protein